MSPQWMPQNIQKRLLLYVLQQLSLFSEIDLPNLEEVSLNTIQLKNILIDPEKVGKLPGCNLRYGQVGSLVLNGGVMDGVNIDAENVELVIAPDFGINEEVKSNVQFSLAQSTTDLANTIMIEKDSLESSNEEMDKDSGSSPSMSESSTSSNSSKRKTSALSGVMSKAVEMALSRLLVKITNIQIKVISEFTDICIEIDEVSVNTINGLRNIKVRGIKFISLKPDVNPGEYEDTTKEREKDDGCKDDEGEYENEDEEDENEDYENDGDGYGDESLMDSMVFTHEEASSIYMSATSQSLSNSKSKDSSNSHKSQNPVLVFIDFIDASFEGLSSISNLEIDIGVIKISAVPAAPCIISIFNGITRSIKIMNYQQRKRDISNNKLQKNSKFPQYAKDDYISDADFEDDDDRLGNLKLNRIHVANITVSMSSSLSSNGEFGSPLNNLNISLTNFNVKQKNESLVYGGIQSFKIIKFSDGISKDLFYFENNQPPNSTPNEKIENFYTDSNLNTSNSHPKTLGKADIRFEIKSDVKDLILTTDITALLSKPAIITFDSNVLLKLINFGASLGSIHQSFTSMMSAIEATSLKKDKKKEDQFKSKENKILFQTASFTLDMTISNKLKLKGIIFPISYNSVNSSLTVQKILIHSVIHSKEAILLSISDIRLITRLQEFKGFVDRNNLNDSNRASELPREVTMSTPMVIILEKISSVISFQELKFILQEAMEFFASFSQLSSQINSIENSLLKKSDNKIENSMFLQSSTYISRKSRRLGPTFNTSSLINTNRLNLASFRVLIKDVNFRISDIAPEFGGINIKFSQISFYQLKNNLQGSIQYFKATRITKDDLHEGFIKEFQGNPIDKIMIPLVLIHLKLGEKSNNLDIVVRHFLIEYFTNWLNFLVNETPEEHNNSKITKKSVKNSKSKRFDFRFKIHDCVIGVNPGRLPSKGLIIINKGNADLTFGTNELFVKSSLRKLSILLIDDLKNLKYPLSASMDPKLPITSSSPLSYYSSIGYIVIGNINGTHLGVTINTDLEEILRRNARIGLQESVARLDIKINSDQHQLDLCADSMEAFVQLVNDLKLPLNFSDEDKIKVELDKSVNLLDDIIEDEFLAKSDIYSDSTSTQMNDFNIIDGYYDRSYNSKEVHLNLKNLNLSESDVSDLKDNVSNLSFEEDHFRDPKDRKSGTKVYPIRININLSKTSVYLYDGYDWKDTRRTIKKAFNRVESQVLEKEEKKNRTKAAKNINDMEAQVDHSRVHLTEEIESEDENIPGEMLYKSIQLSLPKGMDISEFTKDVNNKIQYDAVKSKKKLNQDKSKTLRLRRSNIHKVLIELKNIEVNSTIFTTRDPRKDKTDESLNVEILNKIDLRVDTFDVIDNLSTSTWNKFLTYMNILGEREIGTSMIKLSIINSRPDPKLVASEAIINVSVLPLRLYIDQDTLDFLIRFLEFKDERFNLPIDEILFIQKFEIDNLKLKLDYKPKSVDYSGIKSGKTSEFVNFFILDGSDLFLPKAKVHGILGFSKLSNELMKVWAPHIQQTQIAGLLSGVSPIRSLVNIGSGFKDLLVIPFQEYKKDGRLIRSLQKGTSSFARTTGYELLNLGAKLASGTQVILEQGEELFGGEGASARLPRKVSKLQEKSDYNEDATRVDTSLEEGKQESELKRRNNDFLASSILFNQGDYRIKDQYRSKQLYSYLELDESNDIDSKIIDKSLMLLQPGIESTPGLGEDINEMSDSDIDLDDHQKGKLISLYSNQPKGIKEGVKLAYKAMGKNLGVTKDKILSLKEELNGTDNIQETFVSVVKSGPVILIRPMIGTTEALSKALLGLSNEINSKHVIESKDKYRWIDPQDESK